MYKRLLLDPLEKHHMPPKAKPQLNELEITLIHWWIANNNSFEKKVKDLSQSDKIKTALLNLQTASAAKPLQPSIPPNEIEKAPGSAIKALREAGVIVLPVAVNSNYLQANFVSIKKVDNKTISLLAPIRKQLVWLKLANASLSNESIDIISGCTNLTRLSLEHSNITDSGLATLTNLTGLQYLNLVDTLVTLTRSNSIKESATPYYNLPGQTAVEKKEWPALQKAFPDSNPGFRWVPGKLLAIDTTLVKAPPR